MVAPSPWTVPDEALDTLAAQGWVAVKGWAPAVATAALSVDATALRQAGEFRVASVGTRRLGANADIVGEAQKALDVRQSERCWLTPPPQPAVGNPGMRRELAQRVNTLRAELAAAHGIDLLPFETELSYLHYESGGYYLRHRDTPGQNGGYIVHGRGGQGRANVQEWTFSRQFEHRREYSLLIYLAEQ